MTLEDFLSPAQQQEIVNAIEKAEAITSGEIRVHVEPACIWGDAYARAVEVFNELGMYRTVHRNGVLIYIAFNSHHLAIIGDSGINSQVAPGFWDDEIKVLSQNLAANNPAKGICMVIESVGKKLAELFPPTTGDTNEQPNEISFSNNEK
ncbi:MAG: TPM domain-containing protein [Muribaculaceae bacterium]|nr:TPM domain-containing protein [Muribaculaceae bacterium]